MQINNTDIEPIRWCKTDFCLNVQGSFLSFSQKAQSAHISFTQENRLLTRGKHFASDIDSPGPTLSFTILCSAGK